MTAGERLIQQGFDQGFDLGRRLALLQLAQLRFGGELTPEAEHLFRTASPEQIDHWIDEVLSAPSLAEFLASAP
jgi:hypothetical protein